MMKKLLFIFGLLTMTISVWAQPKMSLGTVHKVLGQIQWKHPQTIEFDVYNRGDSPMMINQVYASCGCTKVEWPHNAIMAGDSAVVKAIFDAEALGHFDKEIAIYSNATPNRLYAHFSGVVVQQITDYSMLLPIQMGNIRIRVTDLKFGDISKTDTPTQEMRIANQGQTPYRVQLMHLPPYVEAEYQPQVLEPNQQGIIRLHLHSAEINKYGEYNTDLYLSRFDGDLVSGENQIPLQFTLLPVYVENKQNSPAITIDSLKLNIAEDLSHKSRVVRRILLHNRGNQPLKIYRVQVFSPAVEARLKHRVIATGADENLTLTIRKKYIDTGDKSLRLLLITNDPLQPKLEMTIQL